MHILRMSNFKKRHPHVCKVLLCVILIGSLFGVWTLVRFNIWADAIVTPPQEFTRLALTTVLTQIALSLFTFLALCVSLWAAGFNRLIIGPSLILKTQFDDLHCVLSNDPQSIPKPTQEPCLSIYIHVENTQRMSAEDCSVTCNQIFVSVDGVDFYKYKTIQTAAFKWAYANKQDPYVATVRRTVEKYARIVEIRQQSTCDNSSFDKPHENGHLETIPQEACKQTIDNTIDGPRLKDVTWFEVLLPMTSESSGTISIPTRYRAILMPISLVSKNTPDDLYYVKVVWKGDSVEKHKQAGFLQCSVVTEAEAKRLIKE